MKVYNVIERFTVGKDSLKKKLGSYKNADLAFMAISEFAHQHVQMAKLIGESYKLQESRTKKEASVKVGEFQYDYLIDELDFEF